VSFVHVVYLNDYHKETAWGITTLSASVNGLGGNGKVGVDYSVPGYYLEASTDKDIIYAFETSLEYPPKHDVSFTHMITTYTYDIITDEWIQKNDLDYIILSIYGELQRTKSINYIHPKFLMIEAPFIKIRDPGRLPQSNYQFQSELYNLCEKKYEKVDEIYKGEQKVFVIYAVK
jgi:hypothetical protein